MRRPWKKKGVTCLVMLFLGLSACLLSQENGPRIKFKEDSWDFGRIKQGEEVTHVFSFSNQGDAPLVINRVKTSCGCTAALVSSKKIEPQQKGELEVTFNSRGYEGQVSKYIYVETNDPVKPRTQLTVSARIDVPPRPRIDLDSYSIDVGLILEGEEIQARTKIRNRGELELRVECSHRNAQFYEKEKEVSFPLKISAGHEKEVEIRIPPPQKSGLIREYVLVKSNDPRRETLSLYLSGYIITRAQLKQLFDKYRDILD
ncbi:MAG: DUF1573 domain-containing protein [Candidatus Aminicenantes bacterium]